MEVFFYGKKSKYSKELKLEIINRYLNGESAFDESSTNRSYSKELKEKVIKDYLDGKSSLEDLANKYNISTHEIVRSWVLKYNRV